MRLVLQYLLLSNVKTLSQFKIIYCWIIFINGQWDDDLKGELLAIGDAEMCWILSR